MKKKLLATAAIVSIFLLHTANTTQPAQPNSPAQKADAKEEGIKPRYPSGFDCSPITSLYLSLRDIDNSEREEPHSGIDAGRLGDAILAPADGVVIAVWEADWGWGPEGTLLIRHRKEDLGLQIGPDYYYSEFSHLRFDEIRSTAVGRRVKRGEKFATVFRPGSDDRYLPEVHWEVWLIDDDDDTEWKTDEDGVKYWVNTGGHLIDPLYMLSLNAPARPDGSVEIPPFDRRQDYRAFRGFTYILPCVPKTDRQR